MAARPSDLNCMLTPPDDKNAVSGSSLSTRSPGVICHNLLSRLTTSCARRFRISVVVERLIANGIALLVEESNGLLKQPRLGVPLRHGCLQDIETVFVHMERNEGT